MIDKDKRLASECDADGQSWDTINFGFIDLTASSQRSPSSVGMVQWYIRRSCRYKIKRGVDGDGPNAPAASPARGCSGIGLGAGAPQAAD
jgi:hypothetical protein